jgi:hypothetical protein
METSTVSNLSSIVATTPSTTVTITPTLTEPISTVEASSTEIAVVFDTHTTTVSTIESWAFATTFTAHETPSLTVVVAPPVPKTTSILQTTESPTLTHTIQSSEVHTFTHVDATYYYADIAGVVTSTFTTEFLYAPTSVPPNRAPSNESSDNSGFDSWSAGAKAGLIIGVIFAALILLWVISCCYKRNAAWVTHDWRWAGAVEGGGAPAMTNANMAHPAMVLSPVTSVGTPSYGYSTPVYMR